MLKPKLGIGRLSIGLLGSYTKVKYAYNIENGMRYVIPKYQNYLRYNSYLMGIRASYHFIIPVKRLDPYLCISGYYNNYDYSDYIESGISYRSHFNAGYYAGVRYYFLPWLGVFGEAGRNGFSIGTAGISFKL